MRGYRPPRPTGYDPEARTAQALWDATYGDQARVNSSSTVKVSRTTRGIILHSKPVKGSGRNTASGLQIAVISSDPTTDSLDYFKAKLKDGTEVSVAKQNEFWPSMATETIDGVLITYTWTNSNHRSSDDGSNSQNEVALPRYEKGKTVYIEKPDFVGSLSYPGIVFNRMTDSDGATVKYLDRTPRVWAKVS